MKLIIYEFKKILSYKYICISFAVLLALNTALCIYASVNDTERCGYTDDIEKVFDMYEENPQRLRDYYDELKALSTEYMRLELEAYRSGNYDYVRPRLPSTLTDKPNITDSTLLSELFERIDYTEGFPELTQKIINNAGKFLENARKAGEKDGFNITYQQNLIAVYSGVKGAEIKLEYIRGYEKYFGYTASDYFLLLLILLAVPAVFLGEYVSGAAPLVRSARHGRLKTVAAKIASLFLFVITAVLLFQAASFVVFGAYYGYSSLSNAVQAIPMFKTCPLLITVGEAIAIGFCGKALFLFAIAAVIAALSMLFRSFKLTFLTGLALGGVNYALYIISYPDAHNFFRQENLFALTDTARFLGKYNAVNVFGFLFEQLLLSAVIYAILFFASLFIVARLFTGHNISASFSWVKFKLKLPNFGVSPKTMVGFEFRKAMGNGMVILAVGLLIAVKLFVSSAEYREPYSFSDALFKDYMTKLEGEWTKEKSDFIAAESARFTEILGKKDEMEEAYKNGEITFEEYAAYSNEYNDANAKSEPFKRVVERNAYLAEAAAQGKNAAFVYDTGYNKLFFAGTDYALLFLFAVLFSGIFADEYASGFDKILRASARGRAQVCRAKFAYALIITTMAFAAFSAVDAVNILKNYDFASPSLPLASIPAFRAFSGLSLAEYIILYYAEKYLAYLIFAALLCGLSLLLKKTVTALFVASGIYFLPYILKTVFSEKFDYIDITNLLSPSGYLIKSADTRLFGVYGLFVLLFCVSALIAAAADAISVRRYCHTY
ncbi:MAG: hypothetical protein WCR95_04935 [Eubacteriales bacterium]